MKPIDRLHRLGSPPANAIRVEVTPITADDGDRRMLGEPGHGLPAYGQADRSENRDEPVGFPGVGGDKVRQALREDAARTGGIPAHEFPHRQLDPDNVGAPGEVRWVALIPTMNGRSRHATARAGRGRRRRRELELHICLLNGDFGEAHGAGWRE